MIPRLRCIVTLVACALSASPLAAVAAPADEIKSLMESGRAAEAYSLGRSNPDSWGDPVFDFYYGIAAIESGNAGEGVLALERYLLNFPDNQSARLQLARGFFVLGEDARAREEFDDLLKLSPPAEMAATIERFLDAIRLRETRYKVSTGLFLEAGVGSDSNVNGGVRNANISLPSLGDVVIAPTGTRNGDMFTHVGAGGYVTYPVSPGVALFATGQAELKQHFTDSAFDQGTYNVSGGASVLREKHLFRAGLNYSQITIDDTRYRESTGPSAEWQYQLDQQQAFSLSGQAARYRYTGANTVRDADFLGLSVGYRKLFSHRWQPILNASLNIGEENALAAGRDDLSRRINGLRVGLSFTPSAKWGVSLGYTYQEARHKSPDAILAMKRVDNYNAFDGVVTYLLTKEMSVRAEALVSDNRSNVSLYSFPRQVYAMKLRYEFQ